MKASSHLWLGQLSRFLPLLILPFIWMSLSGCTSKKEALTQQEAMQQQAWEARSCLPVIEN